MVVNYISIDNEKICIPYFLWGANNSFHKCVAFLESESESLSHSLTLQTPWTIQSMEFSRPEY